jgi:hypothetical protein
MDHRIDAAILASAVLATASCAHAPEPAATEADAAATSSPSVSTPDESSAPPYRAASRELAKVAATFVRNVDSYDSRAEGRLDFLGRLHGITTSDELRQLADSSRARLPWRIMQARGERTRVVVNGVTIQRSAVTNRRVVVEATATTHTGFADVASFRSYELTLVHQGDCWLVADAEGLGS